MLASQPDAIILDFTVPFGLTFPSNLLLHDPASPLEGMVPDDLPTIEESRIEARHVLLAWAAGIPSVRSLAAVTASSLATDPGDDWLRQYVSAHLPLCAVLELPADLLRPLTSAATSILYFGGDRKVVYFDTLASRGDLLDVGNRPWFQKLATWMGGAPGESAAVPLRPSLTEGEGHGGAEEF